MNKFQRGMNRSVKAVQKGFTLIELMIVVAIIGILASVAVPAYQDYVLASEGGAAMKGLTGYVSQAQACIGSGIGCTTLTSAITSENKLASANVTKGATATLTWKSSNDCTVNAVVSNTGGVVYDATSGQCTTGAGI